MSGGLEGAAAQAVLTVLHTLQKNAEKACLIAPTAGDEASTWEAFADVSQTAFDMVLQAGGAEDMEIEAPSSPGRGRSHGGHSRLVKPAFHPLRKSNHHVCYAYAFLVLVLV